MKNLLRATILTALFSIAGFAQTITITKVVVNPTGNCSSTGQVTLNIVTGVWTVCAGPADGTQGIWTASSAGAGTVTTTGSPSSGQIGKFSGGASITNAIAGTDYPGLASSNAYTSFNDFANATLRAPTAAAATISASLCGVGQFAFANNATAGQNLYLCTATNTWTQMAGGGGSGTVTTTGSPSSGQITKFSGGTSITTAVSGTDYAPATSGSSILKGNGSGAFANAVAGTDYAAATSGSAILKGNGAGGFSNAVSSTDYAPATSGSVILKGNGAGGFSATVAGTDYAGIGSINTYTALNDFAGATVRVPTGTLAGITASSCGVGYVAFATDATAGSNWVLCTATNTWSQISNGGVTSIATGTGAILLAANQLSRSSQTLSIANPLTLGSGLGVDVSANITGAQNGTFTGPVTATQYIASGSTGIWTATEGTAPSGIALSDILYADSTSHGIFQIANNGVAQQLTTNTVTLTAGAGGVTAGLTITNDSSNPSKYTVPTLGGCGVGIALTTATNGNTFQAQLLGGLIVNAVADGTITAGDVLKGGTSTAGRVADTLQTSRTLVDSGTCVPGRALTSATVGGTVSILYAGAGSYGSQVNTIDGVTFSGAAGANSVPVASSSSAATFVTATGTGAPVLGTSPTMTTPNITNIKDGNGNPFIQTTAVASAVDAFSIVNAATASPAVVQFVASGSDSNITALIASKGTGSVYIAPSSGTVQINDGTACANTTHCKDVKLNSVVSAGAAPTLNVTSCTGGTLGTNPTNMAGEITGLPTGTCTIVITFSGTTAPTKWVCSVSDETTSNLFRQTAGTSTTATISGTSVASDVLSYMCLAH